MSADGCYIHNRTTEVVDERMQCCSHNYVLQDDGAKICAPVK